MRLAFPALLLVLAGCASAAPPSPPGPAQGGIDPARLSEHTRILSSDAFEGRAPASPAEAKTVAYITAAFRAAGLQPGGDLGRGGARKWTQDAALARFEIRGAPALSASTREGVRRWTQGEQVAIRAPQTGAGRVTLKDAPLVFVGYGVSAPERNWDDFKGVDLKGKVALVLVNDPDFETGAGDFGGKAMTYYGRWTYKYEEAARRGAAGLLVIHETAPAAYGWATVKNSNVNPIFDIVRPAPAKAHAPLEGWIQRDEAAALFQAAGLDFEALKKAAQSRDFSPVAVAGVSPSADIAVDHRKTITRNVVGVLPGAGRPGEWVLYTSHWDHLGIGQPDANGDRIYNGALDNASGVAGLIELARTFAAGPRPQRSIAFLAVTAEEKGLLGSEYYATHPLYPLATTALAINMDGLPVYGTFRDIAQVGSGLGDIDQVLDAEAKARGLVVNAEPRPEAGTFYRSDHFSLAKQGVPALYAKGGEDLVAGGRQAGQAAAIDYTARRYHQPDDEWSPDWNWDGAVAYLDLLKGVGLAVANSDAWPQWAPGAEFKAARDATATQRR